MRALEPARGPRRLLLGGDFLTWTGLADLCDDLTGVRCRRMVVPAGVLIGLGSALDAAKRVRWFDYPLTRDAGEVMATMVPTDDVPTHAELGFTLRPVRDTVEEALRGRPLDAESIAAAAEQAAEGTDPPADLNASSDYKRHLARVLCKRALKDAAAV